jgi:poly-beta-hydroxyalkanoate depolymerase
MNCFRLATKAWLHTQSMPITVDALKAVCKPIYCDVFQTKDVINRVVEFFAVIGAQRHCIKVLHFVCSVCLKQIAVVLAQHLSPPAFCLAGGLWQTVLFFGIVVWLVIAFVARFEDHVYMF